MSLTAVRTTGIYCRSGCGGRPLRRNTVPYESGVAAEAAGFRPCLRCRPDRLPEPHLARTAPPAVAHALVLIDEGYLERHAEDGLARTVGYSGRQLRRLFLEHVGATPSFVARSRQAHFARRLLDETDLPIGFIATIAAFSGPRQLHRAMRRHFGFSPTELRRRRQAGDRVDADSGLRLSIPFQGVLDPDWMAGHLGPRAIPGVEFVQSNRYSRTVLSCGQPGRVDLDFDRPGAVEARIQLPLLTSAIDDVARARHLLGLDQGDDARDDLGADDLIGNAVRSRPGLRVPGCWDRFEALIRIVIGQQVSVAAASTVTGRVAASAGAPVDGDGEHLDVLFPSPEALAEADLGGVGLTDRRRDTVQGVATAVASGVLDLYRFAPLDELVDAYCALPGVGPWTANLAALRLHRQYDAFPSGDLGLRMGGGIVCGADQPLSEADLERLSDRWRPHRALAAQVLWAVASG